MLGHNNQVSDRTVSIPSLRRFSQPRSTGAQELLYSGSFSDRNPWRDRTESPFRATSTLIL